MNTYISMLEDIIDEMNKALFKGASEFTDSDYGRWLDFLRTVHPDSDLLRSDGRLLDTDFNRDMKKFSEMDKVMEIAEIEKYPTWYVQPKFREAIVLEYEKGELRQTNVDARGIPEKIQDFTGKIRGAIATGKFVAVDMDRRMEFPMKMDWLEQAGFATADCLLFPTDKIPMMSSGTAEITIHNYISKAEFNGLNVDGVVIISNTQIGSIEGIFSKTRIAYCPTLFTSN